jgi:hypothetical protein
MKIRRKPPKSAQSGSPLYVVGYSGATPSPEELQCWFDLDYGGPLKLTAVSSPQKDQAAGFLQAMHGPWRAHCQMACAPAEAARWASGLEWRHERAATVTLVSAAPRDIVDVVLLAARLARGLSLLTGGTAFDLRTQTFLNPSDWIDRRLEQFAAADHVTVCHDETPDGTQEWFFTQGLAKFGLNEIESFQPRGLPEQPVIERLTDIAQELIRLGQIPKVGASIALPLLDLSVHAVRHRTATHAGASLILREITWQAL